MIFDNLRNNIDFFIRNKTKFSRKNYIERNKTVLERVNKENLYINNIMERFFNSTKKDSIRALDIGCKNWYYAKGQYAFYNKISETVYMDGVELDAYRLYYNFFSRYEVAKFYTKDIPNINYIAGDLININQKYDYITWILPFVVIEPLKYWGLPVKYFCPEKLLEHAYSLLKTNGQLLLINQGENEAKAQEKYLKKLKIPYKELGVIKSEYYEYQNKRYGFLITKQ